MTPPRTPLRQTPRRPSRPREVPTGPPPLMTAAWIRMSPAWRGSSEQVSDGTGRGWGWGAGPKCSRGVSARRGQSRSEFSARRDQGRTEVSALRGQGHVGDTSAIYSDKCRTTVSLKKRSTFRSVLETRHFSSFSLRHAELGARTGVTSALFAASSC